MPERTILRRSFNTERAMVAPRPRWRGVSHRIAAAVALPVGAIAIAAADTSRTRAAVAAFAVGVTAMFACSALLHLKRWDPTTYERLFRLDHTGIYLAISGTGVAVALLGLPGWPGRVLLVSAVAGGLVGIALEWMPFAPPPGFSNSVYLALGWLPILLLPWLLAASGAGVVALLVSGGVLYTSGAIIVAVRRPDPDPAAFGYHEIFHLLVIAAVVLHAAMVAVLVGRAA
jgi:hemolysin III